MLISIIITTKNEAKNIERCLRSIKNQNYPQKNIEIIVVDNNSTDTTVDIAKKFTKNIFTKGPERSAQRNYGIKKSQGEYILYLDADMSLGPTVVSSAVKKVSNSKKPISALYIPEVITGDSFWSKVRRFERSFYNATVIDCVRFVKRSAFISVGGFDEIMTGPEDWDFDKKIRNKFTVSIIQSPIYHNEEEFEFKSYLSKKKYYAKSFDTYIKKWGKDNPDIKKQFGLLYRYFVVFLEDGKWKKLMQHPILAAGMFFLRFFVGITYLTRSSKK